MGATAATKLCKVCATDVTTVKRFRDQHGNYYCRACWTATQPVYATADTFPCRACGRWFAMESVFSEPDGRTICKLCWQAHNGGVPVPAASLPNGLGLVTPEASPERDASLPEGLELVDE